MSRKLLLLGGGGHCKSLLNSLFKSNTYEALGIVDKPENIGKNVMGVPIIGGDDNLSDLLQDGFTLAFVAIGGIESHSVRENLMIRLSHMGFALPNIIDPSASVGAHVELSQGIYIGQKAIINAGAIIGKGCIINTAAIIEHDCVVRDFSHIAPGAILCGGVSIGNHTHIGAGTVIRQNVSVGSRVVIGMGSVVLHDVPDEVVAYGNPCREVTRL